MQQTPHPRAKEILWNLAGFNKNVIEECKVDGYHATIIGSLLLMVGLYATIAWTFFFQTVFHDLVPALFAGIFMGVFIVAIDRALIASLANGRTSYVSLIFRVGLSILLGIFLSQPIILKLYEPEIKREAQILLDKKVQERKKELEKIYGSEYQQLAQQKTNLEGELETKKTQWLQAEKDFKKEMDGSGGTKRYGYSTVAKKKEEALLTHRGELESLQEKSAPEIARLQAGMDTIQQRITAETQAYREEHAQFGTLIQAEALQSLIQKDKSNSLRYRYYLLSLILTLLELSALIAKLLFRSETYTRRMQAIYETEEKEALVNEEVTLAHIAQMQQLAKASNEKLLQDFFDKSKEVNERKLEELMRNWENTRETPYRSIWTRFRDQFLLKE